VTEDAPTVAHQWALGARRGSWRTARQRGPREWAAGWDRSAPCPPAPARGDSSPAGRGWRSWAGQGLDLPTQRRHHARADVVQQLRRAGYLARHQWPVSDGAAPVYTDGPCAGLRAVDPWAEARQLHGCGGTWLVHLRLTRGALVPAPAPLPCGRGHLCPVCAAQRAQGYGDAARAVVADLQARGEAETVVLVTLTQRALPDEPLQHALQRLRSAWRQLRRLDAWRLGTVGAFWGYEVTHRSQRGWHAHLHAIVVVAPGQREADVRAGLGRGWRWASAVAAEQAGRPGAGWDPHAGGCQTAPHVEEGPDLDAMPVAQLRRLAGGRPSPARWGAAVHGASRLVRAELVTQLRAAWSAHRARVPRRVTSWAGPWWQKLDGLDRIKEAAKYPSPAAALAPLALAEFVTVARGRRWHDGCGVLRGVLAQAERLAPDVAEREPDSDRGPVVNVVRPGACPDLDAVGPDLGWRDLAPRLAPAAPDAPARWALTAEHAGCPAVAAAAAAAGLVYQLGPMPGAPSVPGAPPARWRLAAEGEAPGAAEAVWLVQAAADLRLQLLAQLPQNTTPPPLARRGRIGARRAAASRRRGPRRAPRRAG